MPPFNTVDNERLSMYITHTSCYYLFSMIWYFVDRKTTTCLNLKLFMKVKIFYAIFWIAFALTLVHLYIGHPKPFKNEGTLAVSLLFLFCFVGTVLKKRKGV